MGIAIDRQEPLEPVTLNADAGGGLADPEVAARYVGMTLNASLGPGDRVPKAGRQPATACSPNLVSCQDSNAACSLALKPDGVVASRRHSPSYDSSSRLASGLDSGAIKRHFSPDTTPVCDQPLDLLKGKSVGTPEGPGVAGLPVQLHSGYPLGRDLGEVMIRAVGLSLLYLSPSPGPSPSASASAFGDPSGRLDILRPAGDPGGKTNPEGLFSVSAKSGVIGAREGVVSDDKMTPGAVLFPGVHALAARDERELAALRLLESQWVAEMLILARLRRRSVRDPLLDANADVSETAKTAQASLKNLFPAWYYPIEFNMRVARYIKSRRRDKRRAKKDDQDERQDQSRDAD